MFCCGTDNTNKQQQLIVYDIVKGHKTSATKKEHQIIDILESVQQYIVIKPSKFQYYTKQCIEKGINFVDPEFPPDSNSLSVDINRRVVWKRITDIIKEPLMVQGKIEPADIQQGNIGDCYFLASLASIAQVPKRIESIFQNKMEINKLGIYKLILNYRGTPRQLVIDDYIPVYQNTTRPVFCKPNGRQIWVLLAEKAWAKISGSYGNISSGYPHEVLNTFLVSPCFYYQLQSTHYNNMEQEKIWKILDEANNQNWPCCVGSKSSHICKGINPAHTYSLLASYSLKLADKQHRIIKLRNPWGDFQYIGDYSESDTKFWDKVPPKMKKQIQSNNQNDGVFTLSYEEFLRNFQCLDISHVRDNFNYDCQTIDLQKGKPQYFEITINQQTQAYFTFEKAFDRNLFIKQKLVDYGYSKILLAQCVGNDSYQYIDAKLQPNFPDVTLRCKRLKPGKYVLFIESGFHTNLQSQQATLSVYSKTRVSMRPSPKPHSKFLQKVFLDHAFRLNQQKNHISGNREDWIATKLMYEEGGFGYIAANLSSQSNRKINITYDRNAIKDSYYKIEESIHNPVTIIQPGQQFILLFMIDLDKHNDKIQLKFPPNGVKISKII